MHGHALSTTGISSFNLATKYMYIVHVEVSKSGERLRAYLWGSKYSRTVLRTAYASRPMAVSFLIIRLFLFFFPSLSVHHLLPARSLGHGYGHDTRHSTDGSTEHLQSECHWQPQLFNRSRQSRSPWEAAPGGSPGQWRSRCGPHLARQQRPAGMLQ
jgi:hypothetical protein